MSARLRTLPKAGHLEKKGLFGRWSHRYCCLEGENLRVYESKSVVLDAEPGSVPKVKDAICILDYTAAASIGSSTKHYYQLVLTRSVTNRKKKRYVFSAESQAELDEWLDAINSVRAGDAAQQSHQHAEAGMSAVDDLRRATTENDEAAAVATAEQLKKSAAVQVATPVKTKGPKRPNLQVGVPEHGAGTGVPVPMSPITPRTPKTPMSAMDVGMTEWNDEFQRLVELPTRNKHEAMVCSGDITAYIGRFAATAADYTQTIVDEYHLPPEQKTLPPIDLDECDAPGSEPIYMYDGILFRLAHDATDTEQDQVAAKQAACELVAINAFQATGMSDRLHTVLTTIVDYRGFRVVANAVLPADAEKTLVYGLPADQHALLDREVQMLLERAAGKLNLKQHLVYDSEGRPHELPTSSKLQAHRCDDGRTYIISLGRTMPSDRPQPGTAQLATQLLRPEYVVKYMQPLSSDCFDESTQGAPDAMQNEAAAEQASEYLESVVVPAFVAKLDSLQLVVTHSAQLAHEMHRAGINMRYLGRMAVRCSLPHVLDLLNVEMVARVARRLLFCELRQVARRRRQDNDAAYQSSGTCRDTVDDFDYEVKSRIVDYFNVVLGYSERSYVYWANVLGPTVCNKYQITEIDSMTVPRVALFLALQHHTGFRFEDGDYGFETDEKPLHWKHLKTISSRIKPLHNAQLECHRAAARAERYIAERSYDRAINALQVRLALHRSVYGLDNVEAMQILTDLARMHNAIQDRVHASKYVDAALKTGCRFNAAATKAYITLFETHYALGEADEAQAVYDTAVSVIQWHWGVHAPHLLQVHAAYAALLHADRCYADAAEYYAKCVALAEKILGANHAAAAEFALKLGHVYRGGGELDRAIVMYEKARIILATAKSEDAVETATACYYLAMAYQTKGDAPRAFRMAQQARQIREQALGEGDAVTLNSLLQHGETAEAIDDYATAVEAFERLVRQLQLLDDDATIDEMTRLIRRIVRLRLQMAEPEVKRMVAELRSRRIHHDTAQLRAAIVTLSSGSPSEHVAQLLHEAMNNSESAEIELSAVLALVHGEESAAARSAFRAESAAASTSQKSLRDTSRNLLHAQHGTQAGAGAFSSTASLCFS